MKKIFMVIVAIIIWGVATNYSELYSMFFNQFSKETISQASKIDFKIEGDFERQEQIELGGLSGIEWNNGAVVDIDFDIKNDSDCDIYVRVAILPIILDNSDTNIAYKLSNTSCEIQYCNEDNSNLNAEYWEKCDDGYYYYKKVLKEGEHLENKLVSGVKLNLNNVEVKDFMDKQLKIAVRVESRHDKF